MSYAVNRLSVKKAGTLTGHAGSIYTLSEDPADPTVFYSASGDGTVTRWDMNDMNTATVLAKVSTNIFSLGFLPGYLLLGQMQGGIHVIDLKNKRETKHLAYHKGGIFDIRPLNEGSSFLAAGGDGILSRWQTEGFKFLGAIVISDQSIRDIHYHPEGEIMAVGCSDNNIYLLETKSYKVFKTLEQHDNSVFVVHFSPDGHYLLSGSRDAHLCVWDVQKGFELKEAIPAHLFTINDISFSPDGQLFATASRDKTIKIWDALSFELLKVIDKERLEGHVNSVNKLLWLEQNNRLISASDDRSIMIWEISQNN